MGLRARCEISLKALRVRYANNRPNLTLVMVYSICVDAEGSDGEILPEFE